ncbi:SGNH/GDSL hydrolase family protein, partial [Klebsiella aerogenes]
MAQLPTPTQKPVPSDDIRDHVYAGGMLDKVVTSRELTYTDRLGGQHYTVDGIKAEADKAVKGAQDSITILGLPFATLEDAQAATDAGKIPDGAVTWVRNSGDNSLADEYINNGGTLVATGRKMPSSALVDEIDKRTRSLQESP